MNIILNKEAIIKAIKEQGHPLNGTPKSIEIQITINIGSGYQAYRFNQNNNELRDKNIIDYNSDDLDNEITKEEWEGEL